jgi:hypothetical protein
MSSNKASLIGNNYTVFMMIVEKSLASVVAQTVLVIVADVHRDERLGAAVRGHR